MSEQGWERNSIGLSIRSPMRKLCGWALLCAFLIVPGAASAQWVVFDPANHLENALAALRALESNYNEYKMIKNQIESLVNEARNLESLPDDIIASFDEKFLRLFETLGEINGLVQNLETLEARFEKLYPEFYAEQTLKSRALQREKNKELMQHSREVILGAAKTSALVLENSEDSLQKLEKLMTDSGAAVGALQAMQAGNQLIGTVSGNLINLNSQFATYSEANLNHLMVLNNAEAAAYNRMQHVSEGWTDPPSVNAIPENPF